MSIVSGRDHRDNIPNNSKTPNNGEIINNDKSIRRSSREGGSQGSSSSLRKKGFSKGSSYNQYNNKDDHVDMIRMNNDSESSNNNTNTASGGGGGGAAIVNNNLIARARRVGVKLTSLSKIESMSDTAFRWVDSEDCRYIDLQQNKTALSFVFQQLRGEVPYPNDYWYELVFHNFDRDQDGLIHYNDFLEIVLQYYEHHAERRIKKAENRLSHSASISLPTTTTSASTTTTRRVHKKMTDNGCCCYADNINSDNVSNASEPAVNTNNNEDNNNGYYERSNRSVNNEINVMDSSSSMSRSRSVSMSRTLPSLLPARSITSIPDDNNSSRKQISKVMNSRFIDDDDNKIIQDTTDSSIIISPIEDDSKRDYSTTTTAAGGGGGSTAAAGSSNNISRRVNFRDSVLYPSYKNRLAIFDDYEFFDKAGEGAFGKVLVVRHKATKHVRACKAVGLHSPQQRKLIQTEIDLLKSLDHPNILKLYETYVDGSNMYLIMELCEGGSLQDRIDYHYQRLHSPMTEGQVAMYMQQILSAIAYCHKQGVLHRDLKPENILFINRTRESPLEIIDFGLSCTLDDLKANKKEVKVEKGGISGALAKMMPSIKGKKVVKEYTTRMVMQRAGTPHFMSPEMIQGDYNELTDVWSIGVILYELLTGVHPFYDPNVDDDQSVKAKILKREVEYPSHLWDRLSVDAKDLCKRLLNKQWKIPPPKGRLSAAEALKHKWFLDPLKPQLHGHQSQLTVSVFEGLKNYHSHNKLKQAVLQLLAKELTEFQIQDMRKKFMAVDRDGDGFIDGNELVQGMQQLGYEVTSNDIDDIVRSLGRSGEDTIGFNDFMAAMSEHRIKFDTTQLQEVFKRLDVFSEGRITVEGLKEVLKHEGMTSNADGSEVTDDDLIDIFTDAGITDPHHEGMTFDKFCHVVTGTHPQQQGGGGGGAGGIDNNNNNNPR